jgi:hypothetical protein
MTALAAPAAGRAVQLGSTPSDRAAWAALATVALLSALSSPRRWAPSS